MGRILLRLPAVIQKTGLSRSSIYHLVTTGEFPRPIQLTNSGRTVAWVESELDLWIDAKVEAARGRSDSARSA